MTGYLERLVARSTGTRAGPGATARLRRAPRFPLPGLAPNTANAPAEFEQDPASARSAPSDQVPDRPALERDAGAPRAGRRPPAAKAAKQGTWRLEPAARGEGAREPGPEPAAPTPPGGPARQRSTSPRRATTKTAEQSRPVRDQAPPPAPAELQIRGAQGSEAPVERTTARVPAEAEPHIEVHIGRIEVTGPRPPRRAERPARKPASERRSPRGFGELAAARRYVDRLSR
jgi:hypothetical protein